MTDAPLPLDIDLTASRPSLARLTTARIALGRAGQALPTGPMLAFQLAHARAKDAVHAPLDIAALRAALPLTSVVVFSAAADRQSYLRNPALGRQLAPDGPALPKSAPDLAIIIADGLSAAAVNAHAALLVRALLPLLDGWTFGPIAIAHQGRVALGDRVGEAMKARATLVLIGERPGLSAADSLGAYLTWAPRLGRRDHERNCVSNIRGDGGLPPQEAALKISWLLQEARRLGFTGVDLKDRQNAPTLAAARTLLPS